MLTLLVLGCWGPPCDTAAGPGDSTASAGPPLEPVLLDVAAGTFAMGCADCDPDEQPVHDVTLSAFRIDRYEVSRRHYQACVDAGACAPPAVDGGPDEPVTGVRYDDAEAYCAWRGLTLPTEAQWEYAARGAAGLVYPWGSDAPSCAWAASRACDPGLADVGSHPRGASPAGVEDLAGNAWEWVSDWYDPGYYAVSPAQDPQGGDAGGLRTVRGVDLYSDPTALRASNREYAIPTGSSPRVGFRCAGAP